MQDPRIRAVLDYWFGDLDQTPEYFRRRNQLWFGGGEKVDGFIRERFETGVILAAEGKLDDWRESPKGSLALIVLLDQFSLNLYREQPKSYRQSELAVPVSEHVLAKGWDYVLTPAERVFLLLPFEHSEKLSDQERSVALFEVLARDAPPALADIMAGYHEYAVRHWRVVERFGRFPDRNEVFGRPSRPEELAFLASDAAPF